MIVNNNMTSWVMYTHNQKIIIIGKWSCFVNMLSRDVKFLKWAKPHINIPNTQAYKIYMTTAQQLCWNAYSIQLLQQHN